MKSANSLLRVMLVPFAFALFGGALLLHPVKAHAQTSGVFIPTGSMSAARGQHTATLLPNGKVLIAGGFVVSNGSAVPLASAELYDPTTGTFSATGSMSNGRRLHTATLLPNGNVLIAGGYNDNSGTLATAELYSPATGTFSATGSMTYSRFYAAAAMLPEGKVLIAGGDNDSLALATAELYDPLTATFSATGSMNYQRYELTATLLPNGQVLFVEGRDISNSVIGISELYNTSTKTF